MIQTAIIRKWSNKELARELRAQYRADMLDGPDVTIALRAFLPLIAEALSRLLVRKCKALTCRTCRRSE